MGGYAIMASIARSIWNRNLGIYWMQTMIYEVNAVVVVLFMINISLIEGWNGSWKMSFGLGLIMAIIFSWGAFDFTMGVYEEMYIELWSGVSIELIGFMASCYRVISLFLWKQTLMAVYTRGEWCICIYLSPQIKWHDDLANEPRMIAVESEMTSRNAANEP